MWGLELLEEQNGSRRGRGSTQDEALGREGEGHLYSLRPLQQGPRYGMHAR